MEEYTPYSFLVFNTSIDFLVVKNQYCKRCLQKNGFTYIIFIFNYKKKKHLNLHHIILELYVFHVNVEMKKNTMFKKN